MQDQNGTTKVVGTENNVEVTGVISDTFNTASKISESNQSNTVESSELSKTHSN